MAFRIPDGVHETTQTSGTGPVTLDGAVSGALAASSQLANGDTAIYAIWDDTDIEVGLTTYDNASGERLLRDQGVRNSTAGGAKVDWPVGGTRNVVLGIDGLALASLLNPAAATGFLIRSAANTYVGVAEKSIEGFRPRADEPASMNVVLGEARLYNQGVGTVTEKAEEVVPIDVADPTDPRIDRIVVNQAGTTQVIKGTPDPSPVAPGIPADNMPIVRVTVPAGASSITANDILDERALQGLNLSSAAFRAVTDQSASGLLDRDMLDARYVLQ